MLHLSSNRPTNPARPPSHPSSHHGSARCSIFLFTFGYAYCLDFPYLHHLTLGPGSAEHPCPAHVLHIPIGRPSGIRT